MRQRTAEEKLLFRILAAWIDPGRYPQFHYSMKSLVRTRWPMLANALDDAVKETGFFIVGVSPDE